jgi:hypothetical protein
MRLVARTAIVQALLVAFLALVPVVSQAAATAEPDLEELLVTERSRVAFAQQSRLDGIKQALRDRSDTEKLSGEFVLGVRNRPATEGVTGSGDGAATSPPPASWRTPLYQGEPDYSFSEWWGSASKTTRAWTIVGGVLILIIIAAAI